MSQDAEQRLYTIEDVVRYYEPFRREQMLHFARFVISKGYGTTTITRVDGKMKEETWQAVGRRLFGPAFISAMEQALAECKDAAAAPEPSQPSGPIPDPDF